MKSFLLAVAAVLGLVASADAHGGLAIRRTPFRPFVGPQVVRQNFAFGYRQNFVQRQAFVGGYHAQAFVQPLYAQQFVQPYVQQFVAPQVYVQPQQFVQPFYGQQLQLGVQGGCAACFR